MLDRERLSAITDNVFYDEPMSKHTTFRIGGTADAFVSPENALEIEKIIHFCKDTDTPYMLMPFCPTLPHTAMTSQLL